MLAKTVPNKRIKKNGEGRFCSILSAEIPFSFKSFIAELALTSS